MAIDKWNTQHMISTSAYVRSVIVFRRELAWSLVPLKHDSRGRGVMDGVDDCRVVSPPPTMRPCAGTQVFIAIVSSASVMHCCCTLHYSLLLCLPGHN